MKITDLLETPIDMTGDPNDPTVHGHQQANPMSLKGRIQQARGQLKELAELADSNELVAWERICKLAKGGMFMGLEQNLEQIRHGIEQLAAKRKQGGVASRGIDKNIGERSLAEKINPETLKRFFKKEKDMGWYKLEAAGDLKSRMADDPPTLTIRAFLTKDGAEIGELHLKIAAHDYLKNNPGAEALVAAGVDVDAEYQRKGVASAMYQFAKELGNDVIASFDQSDDAKAMWAGMNRKGVAETIPFAGAKVGQKPADQVRGTDRAKKISTVLGAKPKKHPFDGKLVGGGM